MLNKYFNILTNSYAQIFFSKSRILGIAVLLVTFFDFWMGLMGLLSLVTVTLTAHWFKFNEFYLEEGYYGFNAVLVGLGVAVFFVPGIKLAVVVMIVAVLTLFISLTLEGVLSKYGLPFLGIPFLMVMWIISLSYDSLVVLGISERGIYHYNELYALGGRYLVDLHEYLSGAGSLFYIKDYLLSLSAIAFQYNELAGIIIAVALLISSRISFTLSLVGFYIAILFYRFIGIDYSELSYTYIGFNFILTSMALGGIFLIPSRWSYLWMLILLPITVILTFGMGKLFYYFELPIYSLPFNFTVLMFLYVLKMRLSVRGELVEPLVQYNSPERNLYQHVNTKERFPVPYYLPVYLPVHGEWSISQGHNGDYTHIGDWANAWDFVIVDAENSQYKDSGDYPEDYYCYNKPVIAPADGTIIDLNDGIDDNIIGQVNTIQNWGNSIVIKHSEYLYSQLSHIKSGTFKVKKGDFVKKGQLLANVGNSGRSPYPHLHFQFQTQPYVGSKTFEYPFEGYLKKTEQGIDAVNFGIPEKDEKIQNIETNSLLQSALNFIPGQRLKFRKSGNVYVKVNDSTDYDYELEVGTDAYNTSYFKCLTTGAYAYFENNGTLFRFINYSGNKKSVLYDMYLSMYKIEQGFYKNLVLTDTIPVDNVFPVSKRVLQDFIAPVYIFLKGEYKLTYIEVDNEFSPSEIVLSSTVTLYSGKRKKYERSFNIVFGTEGLKKIEL